MIIAFLRGINVGGRNRLPMHALRTELERLGAREVRTYLQSGNVVFRPPDRPLDALGEDLACAIEAAHGFRPAVLLLDAVRLRRAVEANPYPEATGTPKALHLFFPLTPTDAPDLARLEALRSDSERIAWRDGALYLHAPDGIGRSKLAAGAERAIGTATTARNWATVQHVLALASETDGSSVTGPG